MSEIDEPILISDLIVEDEIGIAICVAFPWFFHPTQTRELSETCR